MSALAIPKRYSVNKLNTALCARLGVKFNGEDQGNRVLAYDMEAGWIKVRRSNGEMGMETVTLKGKVEPYWR
jgi:hypothetical protein